MTTKNRILALDAALVAAGNIPHKTAETDALHAAIATLQEELESFVDTHYQDTGFATFLKDQKDAVLELAKNPEVFGEN